MKVILKISRSVFGTQKLAHIQAVNDDENTSDVKYVPRFFGGETFDGIKLGKEWEVCQRLPFPFNIVFRPEKVENGYMYAYCPSWHIDQNWIDHSRQLYATRTSGGNITGVFSKDGEYFWFADASRCWLNSWHLEYSKCPEWMGCTEVVYYDTSGPDDMEWWENLPTYVERKGPNAFYDYVVDNKTPLSSFDDTKEWWQMGLGQAESAAYHIAWVATGLTIPDFNNEIRKYVIGAKNPNDIEKYVLRRLRNRKVRVDQFDPELKAAWDMLPTPTQERILKWG